jgi:predicted nuclease of predicted toxin-antitoxin system
VSSTTSKPPDEIILMLDENLSGKTIVSALKEQGVPVRAQTDYMERGVPDETLLSLLAHERNVYLLTKDRDFRYKPSVKKALLESKVGALVITATKNKTGAQLVEMISAAWPKIQRAIEKHIAPLCCKNHGGRHGRAA